MLLGVLISFSFQFYVFLHLICFWFLLFLFFSLLLFYLAPEKLNLVLGMHISGSSPQNLRGARPHGERGSASL